MKDIKRVHDLTGQRFGRLTVIGIDESKNTRKTYWLCQCDCGKITSTRSDRLISERVKSCGCYKSEQDAIRVSKNHTHKQSGTRLYGIWMGMKGRCYNPNDPVYKNWGGRGIEVCDEWRNDFACFYKWAVENGYKEDLTIDRINNDGNYTPKNCRWASPKQQARNRRSNINITIGNTTKTLTEWCELFDLPYKTVNARYKRMINTGQISLDKLFKRLTPR